MESKYLFFVDDHRWSSGCGFSCMEKMLSMERAVGRLQAKCNAKRPFVSISVLNPRWVKLFGKEAA